MVVRGARSGEETSFQGEKENLAATPSPMGFLTWNLHLNLFWKILHCNAMYLGEILYVKSDKTVEMYFDL